MLTKRVLYYGKDEPLSEQVELWAGSLHLFFEDGDLRYIKQGNTEILRRIYIAIRDRNWGTILSVYTNVNMDIREDSFQVSFDAENKKGEIDYAWKGQITGESNGTITYSMNGEARSTFLKNRIGFCVLYPADCAGTTCFIEHVDNTTSKAKLPVLIVPQQPMPPFAEMRSMSHQVEPGLWADVRFEGDIFEMEDQRNWTDASYKTFCTPLRLPYPVEIQCGTRVNQSIRLSLRKESQIGFQKKAARAITQSKELAVGLLPESIPLPFPPIGLGMASHGHPLSQREIQRLKALHLDHLRVDLNLGDPDMAETLRRAIHEARELKARLDIALLIPENSEERMRDLAALISELQPPLRTWLVYPAFEKFQGGSPIREVVELSRKYLDKTLPGSKFAAGTNADLIFMARSLPPVDRVDAVTFAIIPEAHAFDNSSIVETLVAQAQAVATASNLVGKLPVMVSPITLKMRFNPYGTGPAPELKPGELPPQVDPRQMSLFGASWTLGSIASLAQARTASLTYFETSGWRGVMETEAGSPLPEIFHSYPGIVYPMYHVFAAVSEFSGGHLIPISMNDKLLISGLLLRKADRQRLFLVNHTPDNLQVRLPVSLKPSHFHHLDESNVEEAMRKPEDFLVLPGETLPTRGTDQVELLPYAFTWIDME